MATSAAIRTGIIGFGLSGRVFHEPFISTNPEFHLEVIATGNRERQAQARAHATVVSAPEELLTRQLDLVVLASPPHAHLRHGIAALEAGAAVVVDKPIAASVSEVEQLIATADRVGRPLIVFQNRRWDGDFRTVKRLLAAGSLGMVHRFESTFERFGGPLRARWQDTATPAEGAGISFDLGSHLVDQALQLFGPATLTNAEVRILREGGASDDDSFLSLAHNSGVVSHLTMSRLAAQSGPRFRVLGSQSAYTVYGLDGQEPSLKAGVRPNDPAYGVTPESEWGFLGGESAGHPPTPVPTDRGDYPAFYSGVAGALLRGAPIPVDTLEALAAFRIIAQAHEMSR